MSSNTLLISVQQIKDRTGLHGNVDEKPIVSDIKFAQDANILPILGTALMDKLQTFIEGAGPTGNYAILLNDYIIDALMYYVLSEGTSSLTFQLYNKGLVKKTSENTVTSDTQDIINQVNQFKKRAEFYGQKLIRYLKQNHALFPEYTAPGNGIDVDIPTTKAYTTTFYMNGGNRCSDLGEGAYQVSDSKFKNNG